MAGTEPIAATSILSDALVILGAAGIVIPLFARFRITPVIGFILVGILVGPAGLGTFVERWPWLGYVTISDVHRLDPFAEFGIIMLLFTVGLELSFGRLWDMRRQVFGLGALELIGCAALIGAGLIALGNSPPTALALGLALALSSTALVLRIVDPQRPVGRAALAMLLFEDIALIPIIFLLGAMGHGSAQGEGDLWTVLVRGAIVIAALLVAGRFLFPRLFAQAARTKSPELFLAASLLVIIVASSATGAVGLSPIVGALIAGLLIAETEYHEEVESITKPFEGLALGVFLITVGMGLDLNVLFDDPLPILAAAAAILIAKAAVTGILLRLMGARRGTSTEAGILMSSPSETTLIVLGAAISAGLISRDAAQFWQIVTALGMTVTPILAWLGRRLAKRVDRGSAIETAAPDDAPRTIIVGFDRVGRLVGEMLTLHDKPFVAIDLDNDQVIRAQDDGLPVVFGDATRDAMLDKLGLDTASAVVLTMDEPVLAQRLVKKLRARHPDLPILARARDARHAASLYRAGATTAVPQTLESSLQLSEAVLVDIGVPMGPVIASIHEKRDEHRQLIREEGQLPQPPSLRSLSLRGRGPTGDGHPAPEPDA